MICPNCRNDVEPVWEDHGVGSYEYWGQQCTDTQMVAVCPECGEELQTENSYEDYLDDLQEDYRERDLDED